MPLRVLSDSSVCLVVWGEDSLAKCQGGTGITRDNYILGHLRSSFGSSLTQSKNKASIEECDLSDNVGRIFGIAEWSLAKGDLN